MHPLGVDSEAIKQRKTNMNGAAIILEALRDK
jgi:hypothetical protein